MTYMKAVEAGVDVIDTAMSPFSMGTSQPATEVMVETFKNNVTEYISADHPLYSEIFSQYSAIESAVKRHTILPSFFSSTADAGAYELKWDGQQYSLTLTDTNGVLLEKV